MTTTPVQPSAGARPDPSAARPDPAAAADARQTVDPRQQADVEVLLAGGRADRAALADLLHDTLAQQLTAARLSVGLVPGAPAVLRECLEEASLTLRELLWWLRPHGEDDLADAFAALAERPCPLDGGPSLRVHGDPAVLGELAAPTRHALADLIAALAVLGGTDVTLGPGWAVLRPLRLPDVGQHLLHALGRAVDRATATGLTVRVLSTGAAAAAPDLRHGLEVRRPAPRVLPVPASCEEPQR